MARHNKWKLKVANKYLEEFVPKKRTCVCAAHRTVKNEFIDVKYYFVPYVKFVSCQTIDKKSDRVKKWLFWTNDRVKKQWRVRVGFGRIKKRREEPERDARPFYLGRDVVRRRMWENAWEREGYKTRQAGQAGVQASRSIDINLPPAHDRRNVLLQIGAPCSVRPVLHARGVMQASE